MLCMSKLPEYLSRSWGPPNRRERTQTCHPTNILVLTPNMLVNKTTHIFMKHTGNLLCKFSIWDTGTLQYSDTKNAQKRIVQRCSSTATCSFSAGQAITQNNPTQDREPYKIETPRSWCWTRRPYTRYLTWNGQQDAKKLGKHSKGPGPITLGQQKLE